MKKVITLIIALVLLTVMAVVASAAVGEVAYGRKVAQAPNMEEIDASWGEPSIYVTKNNPNATLVKYWQEFIDTCYYTTGGTGPNGRTTIVPEDSDFWMYFLYDDKNIYVGFKTPDYHICGGAGGEEKHRGDGIHMWLQPLDAMADPYGACGRSADATTEQRQADSSQYYFFWNLQFDDWTTDSGNACLQLDEKPQIYQFDDKEELHCIIKIPLTMYGLKGKDLQGFEFGICVLRISSISTYDEGYAGWLEWGKWMTEFSKENTSVNTVILYDPAIGKPGDEVTDTQPAETDLPQAADLGGVSSWALTEVEAAINEGLVPEYIQKDWTSPITRGQVSEMFIRLLEKATGKTVAAIIAEKGATIEQGKFEDTNDANVYAANALGIINGTSSSKFSPDGTLKRAQIAALINRVAKVVGVNTEGYTHSFEDITDNYSWVNAELGWPSTVGIINGVSSTKFNPGGDLTTEQAILITYRALGVLKAQ